MEVQTNSSESSSTDQNLAFQLFDGEVMDAKMANFIGIHMLNEIIDTGHDELINQQIDEG